VTTWLLHPGETTVATRPLPTCRLHNPPSRVPSSAGPDIVKIFSDCRWPLGMRRTLDQADHFVRKMDRSIYGLLEAVRTGGAAWEKLHGLSLWDDMTAGPECGRCCDALNANYSAMCSPAIARGYDWSTVQHIVDVGTGRTLATILSAHPHLRGTLVDLPGPVAGAAVVLEEANVVGRCVMTPQSFFDTLPPVPTCTYLPTRSATGATGTARGSCGGARKWLAQAAGYWWLNASPPMRRTRPSGPSSAA
jgi:O-methyltransferase domain